MKKTPGAIAAPSFFRTAHFKENLSGYLFILPGLIFFVIFTVIPFIEAFILSLQRYNPRGSTFIGFENYATLFATDNFWKSFGNTFLFVVIIVPVTMIIALFVSSRIMDFSTRLQTVFRAAFYLPVVMSVVSISLVWKVLLNYNYGVLSYFVKALGGTPVNWLGNEKTVIPVLSLIVVTFSLGQPIILFLAALNGIDRSYYEAADVDGASWFMNFRKITLPLLRPTTLYVLVTTTINAFQTFAIINLMTGGGPNYASSTLLYQIYKQAFTFREFGIASAEGVILFFCVAVFGVAQFIFVRPKD